MARMKDEFLATLSHELRNPLSPILTALHLMRLRAPDTLVRERTIIERQVGHLVRLVDDLLDASRITRSRIELQKVPHEVGDVVARAVEAVRPLLDQKQQHLTVEVPVQGLVVDADLARLAQALAHLLTNAVKFTPVGGEISVHAQCDHGQAVIRVKDSGAGLPAELLPYVFDMFFRELPTPDRQQVVGLGLGLSIARGLMEMHGGHVSAHSEGLGRGSEFTVVLPLSAKPAASPPRTDVDLAKAAARGRVRSRRILVVEDDRDAAALLDEALEAMGHEVRVAFDGPQALAIVEGITPDVILLDIGLPAMDGYELARRLAALPHLEGTVIFAVTGYGLLVDRQRSEEAGFAGHFVKPVDVVQLSAALGALPSAEGAREA